MVAAALPLTYQTWTWRGHPIAYQQQGTSGPAVLFGASAYHWRKNLPDLAADCRVYALDLIGFGQSAKPTPGEAIDYTFETWAAQIGDFCREVIGQPTHLVGNSIGCIAILQAAVDFPSEVLSVALINCSLRLLHVTKTATQPWIKRIGAPILQNILGNKAIGQWFFRQIAQPKTVKNILYKASGGIPARTGPPTGSCRRLSRVYGLRPWPLGRRSVAPIDLPRDRPVGHSRSLGTDRPGPRICELPRCAGIYSVGRLWALSAG
jgi:pimeloyl-ACP methyl ester carboxylesterase